MMNEQEMIGLYENMATITDQMLEAARIGDWDRLSTLEARCADHVKILKTDESPVRLTGEMRNRKVQIIQKILADDREIRTITEPWMAHLAKMINSTGAERKLNNAYGTSHHAR